MKKLLGGMLVLVLAAGAAMATTYDNTTKTATVKVTIEKYVTASEIAVSDMNVTAAELAAGGDIAETTNASLDITSNASGNVTFSLVDNQAGGSSDGVSWDVATATDAFNADLSAASSFTGPQNGVTFNATVKAYGFTNLTDVEIEHSALLTATVQL